MAQVNLKFSLETTLRNFNTSTTAQGFKQLLATLGYVTSREMELDTTNPQAVLDLFG
jgi:hypothetical protein